MLLHQSSEEKLQPRYISEDVEFSYSPQMLRQLINTMYVHNIFASIRNNNVTYLCLFYRLIIVSFANLNSAIVDLCSKFTGQLSKRHCANFFICFMPSQCEV